MEELERYRRMRPETDELSHEARGRVLARIAEIAEATEPRRPRPRAALISLLAAVAAVVAGFVVLTNLALTEERTPPAAGSTPSESITSSSAQIPGPLQVGYDFRSLPAGVTAGPATQEIVRLSRDIEVTASVQRLVGPKGAFATLTVVPEFSGEPPTSGDPAFATLTLRVATPLGEGQLVQATEPGGSSVLYIVTTSGDLIVLSSAQLDTAGLQALAQELTQR